MAGAEPELRPGRIAPCHNALVNEPSVQGSVYVDYGTYQSRELFIDQDDQAELRRGDFGWHVDADLARLQDVIPAWAAAVDGKVLAFDSGGDLRRWDREMIERQARQGALDQFQNEASRAHFGEFGDAGDQVGFADRGLDFENPAGGAEDSLVAQFAVVEEALDLVERDLDGLGGHHDLEVTANVFVEGGEAGTEIPVVVGGERTGMDFEPKSAESAAEARHFAEKLLRMGVPGEKKMA